MKIFDKLDKIYALLSRKHFVSYIKKKGATIGENVYFVNPRHTHFDINRAKFITIGNDVLICSGVSILAHDHSWIVPMKKFAVCYPKGGGKIIIGNNVFIGENATILRNVFIGDNVIVSAGAIVTKDCEPDSVYAGVPAKKIMSLKEYHDSLYTSLEKEILINYDVLKCGDLQTPQEKDMMNFNFLYLERNEYNLKKIISQSWIGCNKKQIKKIFLSTKPLEGVCNYQEFIEKIKSNYI